MKTKLGWVLASGIMFTGDSVWSQSVEITSFSRNGTIAWQTPSNAISTIEWSSSLAPTSTWHRNWLPLVQCPSTNGTGMAAVPMFYRVSSWTNGLLVPSPAGRTYTYAVSNALGQTWTETVRMAGSVSIPSATDNYFLVDVREQYTGDPPADLPKDEIWIGRSTDTQLYGFFGVGREFLVWQNAPIGTTWTNGTEVSTILTNENVSVPAGVFSNCIKTEREETNPNWPYRLAEWIKPGFFMVKWEDYTSAGAPVVYTLTSWSDQ